MSVLKQLNLTNHSQKPARIVDPVMRSREKFGAAIRQQISIYEAEEKGETFVVEKMRSKKLEDGTTQRTPVEVQPRRWWWIEDDVVFLSPKVGVRTLHIQPQKPTIKVGTMKELVPTLKTLAEAAEAGELDRQISEANRRSKSR